jgi:hypothetical protein
MRAALGAELARHWLLKILARELLWGALGVFEAVRLYGKKYIWRATGDVLALSAVTLRLHHWVTLGRIAHRSAIASTFQLHWCPPKWGLHSRLVRGFLQAKWVAN